MTSAAMAEAADDAPTISTAEDQPVLPPIPSEQDALGSPLTAGAPAAAPVTTGQSWPPPGVAAPSAPELATPAPPPAAAEPSPAARFGPPANAPAPLESAAASEAQGAAPAPEPSAPAAFSPASAPAPVFQHSAAGGGAVLPTQPLPAIPASTTGAALPGAARAGGTLWAIGGGLFAVGLALGAVLGFAVSGPSESVAPAPSASHSAPTTAASTAAPAPPEPTPLELVASGDEAAIKALEAKPFEQRTAAEAVALGRGRNAKKLAEIRKLGETLSTSPDLAENPQMLKRLRKHAKDAELAEQVLVIVAGLPGSGGPDLLYDVWFRTRKSSPVAKLAEELLYSKDVRAKASPSLSVVLNLRLEKDCDKVLEIVASAQEHGDRRCLIPLGRLVPKVGCGDNKLADCYACLGKRSQVRDAITAARRRPIPVL